MKSAKPVLFGELPWLQAGYEEPRLSPDGGRLAFVRDGRVHVLDLAGGEERPATLGRLGPETGAAFTGDGGLVVAADLLYLLHAGGLPAEPLAAGREPDVGPGGEILFVRAGELVMRDAAGTERLLAAGGASRPRFSPDGSGVAFLRGAEVILVRGDEEELLATAPSVAGPLVFSPDGRELAWIDGAGGITRVEVAE